MRQLKPSNHNNNSVAHLYRIRHYLVIGLLLAALAGLVFRLVQLMVLDRDFLLDQGQARSVRIEKIPAYRGMITDRHGEPLAISSPVESVWINPEEFNLKHQHLSQMLKILRLPENWLTQRLNNKQHREFMYLRRGISPQMASEIRLLNIPGVYFQREYHRYYPEGEVTSHLLGFTNIDDRGQEGLELTFNQWLGGISGKKKVLKDRLGRVVKEIEMVRPAQPGHDLVLSVDRRIQYIAHEALKDAVARYHAGAASLIVADVQSGEILAMVNYPSFNPNQPQHQIDSRYRNRAVTDLFEPGSTLKPFSMANALEQTKLQPNTHINTDPGTLIIENKPVKDIHNYGSINLQEILQHSSNVGISKITLMTPPNSLWNLLKKLGFGEKTRSQFPGEQAGVLRRLPHGKLFPLATLSFGYGLSTNALQLLQAYMVFATGGVYRQLTLVRTDKPIKGRRVMSIRVANQVLEMMETVLQPGGTATRARISGYRVAGKTGTVRMVGTSGYREDRHMGLFVGIAPVSKPKLAAVVVMSDMGGQEYYGGKVAAPVFSKVIGNVLHILNVPPDADHETTEPELVTIDEVEQDAA